MTPQRQRIASLKRELRNAVADKLPAAFISRLQTLLAEAEAGLSRSREAGESRTVADVQAELDDSGTE